VIQDEIDDPNFNITRAMIYDIFTIPKGSSSSYAYSAVSGGLQAIFT
jgi:hypothetical protein